MKKAKQDDVSKAERIYYKYRNLIYLIAFEILKDIDLSEDAVQDTVVKILKNIDKINFNSDTEEKNYIARIARNVSIDIYSKQKRFYKALDYSEELKIDDDAAGLAPEEYVITKDSVEKIVEGIRDMDTKYSDPLRFQKFNNYSIEEIAQLEGVSQRTVFYRIKTAKKCLRLC